MITAAIIAFGVSLVSMPLLIRLAHRLAIEDVPDGDLKPHKAPTPVLGGIGIVLGTIGAFASVSPPANPWLGLLAVGLGLAIVGLADDLCDLRPALRLFSQILAGAGLVLLGHELTFGQSDAMRWLSYVGTAVAIVGAVNAINMLDGIDGLCGGCSLVSALAFAACLSQVGDDLGAILALGVACACSGFLMFNFNPARIFMGDSGSYFVGASLAVLLIRLERAAGVIGFAAGMLVLAVPVLDTSWAIVRRVASGKSPFAGDRGHIYDRMVDRGISVRATAVILYIASAIVSSAGYLLLRA